MLQISTAALAYPSVESVLPVHCGVVVWLAGEPVCPCGNWWRVQAHLQPWVFQVVKAYQCPGGKILSP